MIVIARAPQFAGCWMRSATIASLSHEPGLFQPIIDSLLHRGDYYFHLADFDSYLAAQQRVSCDFQDVPAWTSKAILNVARSGKFSSDRAVAEYASDIWGIMPMTG